MRKITLLNRGRTSIFVQTQLQMKKVSLQFKSLLDLLEYIDQVKKLTAAIDKDNLTIREELDEAEVELALNGFNATILEATASEKRRL